MLPFFVAELRSKPDNLILNIFVLESKKSLRTQSNGYQLDIVWTIKEFGTKKSYSLALVKVDDGSGF